MKFCGGLLVASLLCGLAAAPVQAREFVWDVAGPGAPAHPRVRLAQAAPQPDQPATPASPAPADQTAADAAQQADDEPAGNVATLEGTATVTRNGTTTPLKLQDDIYKGDTLQTGKNSSLGVTFSDDTTLKLSASSRIVVDNFVYREGGKDNAALINVTRGTMAFVAAAVAKTGDMKIETPTATLGIRGTTGVVNVPEGAKAGSANDVGVKLYPDADGRVGRIEVRGRDGAPLGMLTQAATGFTLRGMMVSGFGMRMSAVPMVISARQMDFDRRFVQRVQMTQGIGRQIVTQQRNFRLQNPRQPGFGRPGQPRPGFNQPGQPQRPGMNQPGQQRPGLNQPGQLRQPQRPGLNQPGQPPRPGLNQPGQQRPPGMNQPGQPQPGRPGQLNPPGPRNPPGLPTAPGQPRPPGLDNRTGLPGTPGQPGRVGLPNQPGMPRQGGVVPPGGGPRPPGAPGQIGARPGIPNQPNVQRQTGVPPAIQRPSGGGGGAIPNIPGIPGAAGGILNRLGVPGQIVPQLPAPQLPAAAPRGGQQAAPPAQQRRPPAPKDQKQPPKEQRESR